MRHRREPGAQPRRGAAEPSSIPFEQYEYHSAWERPGGLANRSGADDLDVIIYSARKWVRLALGGNPTVLLPLFVPEDEIVAATAAGHELRANADRIASRRAAERFRLPSSRTGQPHLSPGLRSGRR